MSHPTIKDIHSTLAHPYQPNVTELEAVETGLAFDSCGFLIVPDPVKTVPPTPENPRYGSVVFRTCKEGGLILPSPFLDVFHSHFLCFCGECSLVVRDSKSSIHTQIDLTIPFFHFSSTSRESLLII